MTDIPTLVLWYENHLDLLWRRPWRRSYTYLGLTYRSGADLQEAIIGDSLKLAAEQGASFQLEQALSVREYLRRHPESLGLFQQLSADGRFMLKCAGEAIIDINQCDGETMARNLASGILYARKLGLATPPYANHGDGFGSSAQLPQVVRLCGLQGVHVSYLRPDAAYWRGLDGSTVLADLGVPSVPGPYYDACYYEPCLVCRGEGHAGGESPSAAKAQIACPRCRGTGLRLAQGYYPPREFPAAFDQPLGRLHFATEEYLPNADLPEQIRRENARGLIRYRWGTERMMVGLLQARLERVDDPGVPVSSRVENNPVQTGTYVSRIRVKQAARRAEAYFYAAEKLAALAGVASQPQVADKLQEAWLHLPIVFFHDAVTGTHVDPAQEELLHLCAEVERLATEAVEAAAAAALGAPCRGVAGGESGETPAEEPRFVAVFNPGAEAADIPVELVAQADTTVTDAAGCAMPVYRQPSDVDPAAPYPSAVGPGHWQYRDQEPPRTLRFLARGVPPMSLKTFALQRSGATGVRKPNVDPAQREVSLGQYRIGWDDCGVTSLVHLPGAQELLDASRGRLGELILEQDYGDLWGTRSHRRDCTSCIHDTRLLAARQMHNTFEVIFHGRLSNGMFGREVDTDVFGMEWYQTVRLGVGLPWAEVDLEVFWQASNRRIRLVFPSRSDSDRGVYSIPYGSLQRDRYEMTDNFLWSPNGDWPAVHFAATLPAGSAPGLAVFNAGTPSVRIEDGKLMYSVLRSPTSLHCLSRYAQEYPVPVAEMRDSGHHQFRFAIMPFTGQDLAQLTSAARMFSTPAVWVRASGLGEWNSGLSLSGEGAAVTAVKPAFAGEGIAVRVVEQRGLPYDGTLNLPVGFRRAWKTNLLEEPAADLPVCDGRVALTLRAWEIATVLLD